MKQSEVQIGKVYQVKVSGVLKPVRVESMIERTDWHKTQGWRNKFNGTVLTTGRKIRLTAGRMRKELGSIIPLSNPEGYLLQKEGEE